MRSDQQPVAITNAAIFDGKNDKIVSPGTVVFSSGRITDVGPSSTVMVPEHAQVIDGSGKTLLPGLIDMHVHLKPGEFSLFLGNGVTSVKDVGNQLDRLKAWRAAEVGGEFPSPRIHFCGPLLEGDPPMWPDLSIVLTDSATAVSAVDDLADAGVDALKLYMRLTTDVMQPLIARAHQHGLPVTAHLGRVPATDAVAVGLDGIEHAAQGLYNDVVPPHVWLNADERIRLGQSLFWAKFLAGWAQVDIDDDAVRRTIDLFVENDTFIVCTLVAHGFKLGPDALSASDGIDLTHVPDSLTSGWGELVKWFTESWTADDYRAADIALEKIQSVIGAFHDAGGRVIAGTDSPVPYVVPGASLHQELELLVGCGLSTVDALRSATSIAAEALGRSEELGAIEVGKAADLVLVDGDPVADIRTTRRISAVFKEGQHFDPAEVLTGAEKELRDDHPVALSGTFGPVAAGLMGRHAR